jgi:hypothetical protein
MPSETILRRTRQEPKEGGPLDQAGLRYELAVSLDLAAHELAVEASVHAVRPRSKLYLHPGLAIEDMRDEKIGSMVVPFKRSTGRGNPGPRRRS